MEKEKSEAVLMLLSPQIIHMIAEDYQLDEVTAYNLTTESHFMIASII